MIATLAFFALTTAFAIAAHLLSELAGLGWHDGADVIISPRHAYLALLALMTFGASLAAIAGVPRDDRARRVASVIDELPFRGRGVRFTALSFVAQFAFFALTQIGEGCPLCAGDVVIGVFAAAVAAALGAVIVACGKRRLVQLAFALARYLTIDPLMTVDSACAIRATRTTTQSLRRRTPFAFRYRPPPLSAGS